MKRINAKKKKEQKKPLVVVAVVAMVVVLAVVIAILIGLKLNAPEEISDGYFVSDDSKIVLSLDRDMASFQDGEFEPSVTHVVYYCSGDTVTNIKYFFAYDDEEKAGIAYAGMSDDYKDWASSKKLDGRYIIFQDNEDSYENLSAEKIRSNIKSMQAVGSAL